MVFPSTFYFEKFQNNVEGVQSTPRLASRVVNVLPPLLNFSCSDSRYKALDFYWAIRVTGMMGAVPLNLSTFYPRTWIFLLYDHNTVIRSKKYNSVPMILFTIQFIFEFVIIIFLEFFFFLIQNPSEDHTWLLVIYLFSLLECRTVPELFWFLFHETEIFEELRPAVLWNVSFPGYIWFLFLMIL